ncbi:MULTISPECIES: hypothetical protein [Corynebacterium]|nr:MULTISPECIES: hypothetical protein [Corynebacterium]MDK7144394.1 hypothetical protein [Corynebacterium amycolatum]
MTVRDLRLAQYENFPGYLVECWAQTKSTRFDEGDIDDRRYF